MNFCFLVGHSEALWCYNLEAAKSWGTHQDSITYKHLLRPEYDPLRGTKEIQNTTAERMAEQNIEDGKDHNRRVMPLKCGINKNKPKIKE